MADELMLEILKNIQANVALLRDDVASVKGRFTLMQSQLAGVHAELAGIHADIAAWAARWHVAFRFWQRDSKMLTILVKTFLYENGCHLSRKGCYFGRRVDKDIWHSPITGKSFLVDSEILLPHAANDILEQAGLPKRFQGMGGTRWVLI